jgi:hypothetical protein
MVGSKAEQVGSVPGPLGLDAIDGASGRECKFPVDAREVQEGAVVCGKGRRVGRVEMNPAGVACSLRPGSWHGVL